MNLRKLTYGWPALLMAGTALVELIKGSDVVSFVIALLAALSLGLLLVFSLRCVALLIGAEDPGQASVWRRARSLEADLRQTERTLAGIELDRGMRRINDTDAEELAGPLRERFERARVELEALRRADAEGVEWEIQEELRRRLRAKERLSRGDA